MMWKLASVDAIFLYGLPINSKTERDFVYTCTVTSMMGEDSQEYLLSAITVK